MYRYRGDGITTFAPNYLRREGCITAELAVDCIDQRILARLQADGRASNKAVAEDIGLSASACLARVRRLEDAGLIMGYHALIDLERVRPTVTIFAEVTLGQHHPGDFARFEGFVTKSVDIVEASQVSGPYDYLMRVIVSNMGAWRDLSDHILTADLGVTKISSHVVMKPAKAFGGAPLAPAEKKERP